MTVLRQCAVYAGRLGGYRAMWRLLIRKHHVRTSHATVRLLLRQMDPAGVMQRRHHRLQRRTYFSRGPNDTWHVDGYDKLRPYGILINGYVIMICFRLQHYCFVYMQGLVSNIIGSNVSSHFWCAHFYPHRVGDSGSVDGPWWFSVSAAAWELWSADFDSL